MAKTPPPAPTPPPGSPDRRALLEAFQEVVRTEQEKKSSSAPSVPSPTRWAYWLIMTAVIAGLVAVLVVQPGWLFSKPIEEPPALREASLRVRMFVEIERVDQYRSQMGHLPSSLAEAGADSTGLKYTHDSTGFSITGVNEGLSLTYTSPTPPRDFLGNSYALISQRRRK
jgi:hypothetical protein